MADQYVERVIDLTDPAGNRLHGLTLEEARSRVAEGSLESVRAIDGSFALVARNGRRVRLARSLDRPMRYFLAKQAAGPALVVADRIDTIRDETVYEFLEKHIYLLALSPRQSAFSVLAETKVRISHRHYLAEHMTLMFVCADQR